MLFAPETTSAQSVECDTELPAGAMQILLDEQQAIQAFKAARASQLTTMSDVPVRFTAIQGSGGSFAFGLSEADFTINTLNQVFAPAGLNFIRCGDLNDIFDDRIRDSTDIDKFITSFSYTSGALEVYLKPGLGLPISVIPLAAYQAGNPNGNYNDYEHTNWIRLRNSGDLGRPMIHETGHQFGLLHTHHVVENYNQPMPGDDTDDYPYPVLDPQMQIVPSWWGRELVIRNNLGPNDPRPFKEFNWRVTGDLIEDTPADCNPTSSVSIWPGCTLSAQNPDCSFNTSLGYTDYNGDSIRNQSAYPLGRNFMSYWNPNCLIEFTPLQYNNIAYYNETARQPHYSTTRCGTFTDKVEFQGTAVPLHNVTLRVRHPNDLRKCNVTSSLQGNYSGMLHTDELKVYAYHNGKKETLEFANDALKMHYGHKKCEWRRGVNAMDFFLITQHIVGIQPLTSGYSKIAADATQNNQITTLDNFQLRKMVLEDDYYIPGVEQPWRFIPEFVPQDLTGAFNQNPFALLGGAYLQQGWQFSIPVSGKRGFDGIKIGDVNSSWPTDPDLCPTEGPDTGPGGGSLPSFSVPSSGLGQNQVAKLTFKIQNFQQVKAFQLGINLPHDFFEVLDVVETSLPSFNKEDNFGLADLETNAVRTLWFDPSDGSQTLSNNSTLFAIVVKAKQPIANLQSLLRLDNFILPSFFWGNTTATTSLSVVVESYTEIRSDSPKTTLVPNILYCEPNPFDESFRVMFLNQGEPSDGTLKVVNISGQSVFEQKTSLSSGENTLEINAAKNFPTGVYTLSLYFDGQLFTKKIVKN